MDVIVLSGKFKSGTIDKGLFQVQITLPDLLVIMLFTSLCSAVSISVSEQLVLLVLKHRQISGGNTLLIIYFWDESKIMS